MSKKNKIITSENAKEMMSFILPFYDNDEYLLHAFQAIGIEWDKVNVIIDTFFDQIYPQRATWSVFYWEQLFGLPVGVGETYEERRKRILTHLGSGQPINRSRIETLASNAAGTKVTIKDLVFPYTFRVFADTLDFDFVRLVRIVDDVKPAHLSYFITPRIKEKINFKDSVYVNLRRYHTVREFRVGMTPMMEQNEVKL